ncbi:unnamed protein product [Somion occarium]|uniref:Uncharacterized protein n=1 Tax=Somion occarium TaxID=3059160 RepID=A0ABP1CUG8_9APHY
MTSHDEHREAHVRSLRLALGSILSPKRVSSTRSSATTSGTASPLHPSVFSTPSLSTSSEAPPTPHDRHNHRPSRAPISRAQTESNLPVLSKPQMPSPLGSGDSSPECPSSSLPVSSSIPGGEIENSSSRADFIGTLQSKKAWDALIHGSFV